MSRSSKYIRPIVGVDFDLTLSMQNFFDFNTDVGSRRIRPDAVEALKWMYQHDCVLILWTCREGEYLVEALEFLQQQGVLKYFHAVNDNYMPELHARGIESNPRKIIADYYIDDLHYDNSSDLVDFNMLVEVLKRDLYIIEREGGR